jgi:hypothetical protein
MDEEFYCCLKLVSGEEIFSLISVDDNNGDPLIVLQDPVIMEVQYNKSSSLIRIKPWMDIPKDNFYIIKFDKVITMTEIFDKTTINIYRKYLNDESTENGRVELTTEMGYISSVEDARKRLEESFNNLKDI